ncbi:MAG: MATE family efflux transporter [Clostridia bacterium]|nr:MATE family efflux transporter [Clostridia bacterium]
MKSLVREKSFYKTFFSMTGIIALQNLIVFSVNLADNVMLTHWSADALAGVALVNQIQFLLQMLMQGIGEGALVFSSRSWGEGKREPIRAIANIGMRFALAVSLLLGVVVFAFPEAVLGLLSSDAEIVAAGAEYARIIVFTYPVFAVSQILLIVLRSVETVRIGFWLSVVALISNISLNYVLIFGRLGLPALGIRGAAIATLLARLIELCVLLVYVRFMDKKIALRTRHFFRRTDRALVRDYIRVGLPVFLSGGMWGIAQAMQTAVLGHMDGDVISANAVAVTLFQIISVFMYASASSTAVMVGKIIGEGREDLIRPYTRTFQLLFVGIGLASGLTLFLLRHPILALYANLSAEAERLSLAFISILAVTSVGTAYQMPCLTGIVRSGGDTGFVLKNDFIFMWLIVLPSAAAAAFIFELSPVIVFICLKADQILKCFVAVIKINRYNWLRRIRKAA